MHSKSRSSSSGRSAASDSAMSESPACSISARHCPRGILARKRHHGIVRAICIVQQYISPGLMVDFALHPRVCPAHCPQRRHHEVIIAPASTVFFISPATKSHRYSRRIPRLFVCGADEIRHDVDAFAADAQCDASATDTAPAAAQIQRGDPGENTCCLSSEHFRRRTAQLPKVLQQVGQERYDAGIVGGEGFASFFAVSLSIISSFSYGLRWRRFRPRGSNIC